MRPYGLVFSEERYVYMPSLQREQSCMADADAVGTIYFIGVSSVFCPFSLSTQRVRK